MEQLFFAGKAYLKINSLVKTPLHEFMAVECSGLWAPELSHYCFLSCIKRSHIDSYFSDFVLHTSVLDSAIAFQHFNTVVVAYE